MAPLSPAPLPPPARASRYDDAELLERYFQRRDPRDREALVQRYLPLARHLGRRYYAAGERDDLDQVASVGLLKAIDRFDPTRGLAFTSFAVPTIVGELKRYFRDHGWSVHVPRALKELAPKVGAAADELFLELGRSPTIEELAQRTEATVEAVLEARQLATAHRAASLDVPVISDESSATRGETIAVHDDGFARAEQAADLDRLLARLPELERTILHLRFRQDLTQREIARHVGRSQMQVSRLIRSALAELSRSDCAPPAAQLGAW